MSYNIGVISGAKTPMQRDMALSCSHIEVVVAFLPVGAFVASLVGGAAVDRYGRRLTIVVNAMLFTGGALILATRDAIQWKKKTDLSYDGKLA